jgi:protoporphyrinogen oxidase
VETVRLLDPLLRSSYGVGHDRISAWAALDILSDEMLPADNGESSLCGRGGNAFLTGRLVKRLGAETLQQGAFVTQVRQVDNVVHVGVLRQNKLRVLTARAAIYAAPQLLAPHLIPDLPANRRAAVKSIEYAPYLVANIGVNETPPHLVYSNQMVGDFLLSDFIVADWAEQSKPQTAADNRPNVLTAYVPLPVSERTSLLTDSLDDWQAKLVADLEKCLPGIGKTVTAFHLYRWGHAFAVPVRGWVFSPVRQSLRQPLGLIFFAGADVEGIPTVDHAMAAGFRSAHEAATVLRNTVD